MRASTVRAAQIHVSSRVGRRAGSRALRSAGITEPNITVSLVPARSPVPRNVTRATAHAMSSQVRLRVPQGESPRLRS
jgi:hypothetical protein